MRKKGIKAKIARIALTAAMTLALGIPVCAASAEANAEIARGATQYADYNLTIHSGTVVYTKSGQNFAHPAVVKMEGMSAGLGYVEVATYDASTHSMASKGKKIISGLGTVTIDPAANYPGQYICAGFYREGIEGEYSMRGKFYYYGS